MQQDGILVYYKSQKRAKVLAVVSLPDASRIHLVQTSATKSNSDFHSQPESGTHDSAVHAVAENTHRSKTQLQFLIIILGKIQSPFHSLYPIFVVIGDAVNLISIQLNSRNYILRAESAEDAQNWIKGSRLFEHNLILRIFYQYLSQLSLYASRFLELHL
jgi:hypothetical protein